MRHWSDPDVMSLMSPDAPRAGFLEPPVPSRAAEELQAEDLAELGYVANLSRVWSYDALALDELLGLSRRVARAAELSIRHRLLLVLATSAARRSTYCIYAWGSKFAAEIDARSASAVVRGDDDPVGLTAAEVALVHWARSVATMPSSTTAADVDELRETGWSDDQIFAITVFSALRMAFSTVNDALGADPDPDLAGTTPLALQEVLSFGRHLG